MHLNSYQVKLLLAILEEAQERYSNDGCEDFEVEGVLIPDEIKSFRRDWLEWVRDEWGDDYPVAEANLAIFRASDLTAVLIKALRLGSSLNLS